MRPEQISDLKSSLYSFTAHMFRARRGTPLRANWHQVEVCEALERVVLGKCPRLIINVPPRSGKTEIAVVNFVAWAMGLYPDAEWIHASYSKRLAAQNAYNIRAMLRGPAYQAIFPDLEIVADSRARDEFRTTRGGVVYATGSEGTITGYGAGKMRDGFSGAIIIDDPAKAGEASSPLMRQNVIDWFQVTMESRKNRQDTPIIVIMQRLHEEDLSGWLLAGGNGEQWEHLVIPAIDGQGRSFWQDQFPIADLLRKETASPYVFAGQYMQTPKPRVGGMFPVEKFAIRDQAPANADIERSVRYWDKAGTATGSGAETAGVLMHKLRDGRFVIGHVVHGRWGAMDREAQIKAWAEVDGFMVEVGVEQEPGSGGKESAEATIRNLAGFNVYADRPTGSKEIRADPYSSQVQGGNISLVRAPWNKAFLDQHELFPNGKLKDMVDAASAAFSRLAGGLYDMETLSK